MVRNHSPRIFREVRLTKDADGHETVEAYFTTLSRRKELTINQDEVWRFFKGQFTIIHRTLRNGRMIREHKQDVPPLLHTSWMQNNDLHWLEDKLNQEQTARCIVEQYLYENVPDPDSYRVVSFDFTRSASEIITVDDEPLKAIMKNRSFYMAHAVRPKVVVMEEAQNDRSENADAWMELFEGTSQK
jgi:hypothetical protein